MKQAIFYLKKIRKERGITLKELQNKTKIYSTSLSRIELGKEEVGEKRSKEIAEALGISEDVITVYSGKIPKYAYEVYKKYPEKLERLISGYFHGEELRQKTADTADVLEDVLEDTKEFLVDNVGKIKKIRPDDIVKLLSKIESHGADLQKFVAKVRKNIESADDLMVLKDEKEEENI